MAVTLAMMTTLRDQFLELTKDEKTTVVLLQAAGNKVFSAGVDSQEILTLPPEEKAKVYELMVEIARLALTSDKILIVALNGLALGMGAALVLAADLRIAIDNPDHYMQLVEVDVGMFPFFVEAMSFYHFPPALATKLVFGGDKFSISDMNQVGFLHSVHSTDDFPKAVRRLTRQFTQKRSNMLRLSKECLVKERELLLKQIEIENTFAQKFYSS